MDKQTREGCYNAIRECIKTRTLKCLEDNPNVVGTVVGDLIIKESLSAVECIFKILDKYTLIKVDDKT
jgi:hypothetical protein